MSASICFGRLHIIPHLSAFLDEHPNLDLELVLDDRLVDLVNEGVDVALRTGALPNSNMTARRIAEGRTMVVATPAYLQRQGVPTSPEELANHQAIILTRGGGRDAFTFRKAGKEAPVSLQGRMKVTQAEGLREAVNCGLGFAVTSEWLFTPELKSGTVVPILQDWSLPSARLSAVFPMGRLASIKARAFVSFVERVMTD